MADNVIRRDIVQLDFNTDLSGLTKVDDALDGIKKALSGVLGNDAFSDMAKDSKKAANGVEDVDEELKDGEKSADKFGDSLKEAADTSFSKLASGIKTVATGLGKGLVTATKVGIAGLAATGTAIGALVTQSVTAYADYEQLVGGVDTLFKDSSGIVQKNANNAFKTAGLSANSYMETVTSFSASLISSLGGDTEKAANYADMAITDMADNANKMGTDISILQTTYGGFAKQNYTMLDNLNVGGIAA